LQSGFRSRMVHAHGWPFGTTEAAVRTAFPAALCVKLEDDEGRYQRRASMVFPTTEGAKGAAGNGMAVDGLRLVLKWGGGDEVKLTPAERSHLREASQRCTASMYGWPLGTTEGMMRERFPTAIGVELEKDAAKTWYARVAILRFRSVAAARTAAEGWTTEDDRPLGCWEGDASHANCKAAGVARDYVRERMVFVSVTEGTTEATVRAAFPTASVVGIRKKRFALEAAVFFATPQAAREAAASNPQLRPEWGGCSKKSKRPQSQ